MEPLDPETRNRPAANGTANPRAEWKPDQRTEAVSDWQAKSELERVFAKKFIVVRKRRRSAPGSAS
jgi:hypothetical protein